MRVRGKCIVLHSYSPGLFFLVSVDRSWVRTQARLKTSERYVTSIPTFITRVASELAPNTNRNIRIFCLFICLFCLFDCLFIYLLVYLFICRRLPAPYIELLSGIFLSPSIRILMLGHESTHGDLPLWHFH